MHEKGDAKAAEKLGAMAQHGRVEHLRDVMYALRAQGYDLGTHTYHKALHVMAAQKNIRVLSLLLRSMKRRHIHLRIEAYNALLDLCLRTGHLQGCLRISKALPGLGIQPDRVTMLALLRSYGELKEAHDANVSYGLPSQYADAGEEYFHRKATQLLVYAERAGYPVDSFLLTAALPSSTPESIGVIIEKMREMGIIDVKAYSIVLKTASRWHCDYKVKRRFVETTLCQMKEDGVALDSHAYSALLTVYKDGFDLPAFHTTFIEAVKSQPGPRGMEILCTNLIQVLTPFVACGSKSALAAAETAFRRVTETKKTHRKTGMRNDHKHMTAAMAHAVAALAYSTSISPLNDAERGGTATGPHVLSDEGTSLIHRFQHGFPCYEIDQALRGEGLGFLYAQAERERLLALDALQKVQTVAVSTQGIVAGTPYLGVSVVN